jgi:DNA polymerase-3 subunit alpha
MLSVTIADLSRLPAIARELAEARGGNGTVRAVLPVSDDRQATLVLGRDFTLDADLAARLTRILGEGAVELSAQEPPRLALVG